MATPHSPHLQACFNPENLSAKLLQSCPSASAFKSSVSCVSECILGMSPAWLYQHIFGCCVCQWVDVGRVFSGPLCWDLQPEQCRQVQEKYMKQWALSKLEPLTHYHTLSHQLPAHTNSECVACQHSLQPLKGIMGY